MLVLERGPQTARKGGEAERIADLLLLLKVENCGAEGGHPGYVVVVAAAAAEGGASSSWNSLKRALSLSISTGSSLASGTC